MAYTQAQLAAIKKSYATGTLEVEYDGRRVKYRSLAEMRQIIADIEAELSPASAPARVSFAEFSRE